MNEISGKIERIEVNGEIKYSGDVGPQGEKGDKGDKGEQGNDGVSPIVTVSKSGKTTTIEITDKDGIKTATIEDGAEYDDTLIKESINSKTNTSVLPNNGGPIKTKYRINKSGYVSGDDTHYYPLCSFPIDNGSNCASAIISGRVGGYVNMNMSYINALLWNRDGCGISLIDIAGGARNIGNVWIKCDIVIYTNEDNSASVYLKCKSYYAFDLNLELFQKTASIDYTGNYTTTEPSGTLMVKASTSNKRLELVNEQLLLNGKELALKENVPTKTSDLNNDSGYITDYTETDPTVPGWAKQSTKPSYTPAEVGAMPASSIVTAFWSGTQTEYDALGTYNTTTLYLIKEG